MREKERKRENERAESVARMCGHTCHTFPAMASLTVKAGDWIGTAGCRRVKREERTREERRARVSGSERRNQRERIITGGEGKRIRNTVDGGKTRYAVVKNGNDNDDRGPINYRLVLAYLGRCAQLFRSGEKKRPTHTRRRGICNITFTVPRCAGLKPIHLIGPIIRQESILDAAMDNWFLEKLRTSCNRWCVRSGESTT